jgi:hypothetical protein
MKKETYDVQMRPQLLTFTTPLELVHAHSFIILRLLAREKHKNKTKKQRGSSEMEPFHQRRSEVGSLCLCVEVILFRVLVPENYAAVHLKFCRFSASAVKIPSVYDFRRY